MPEEKLDANPTRMLSTALNKSWKQHPTKHQLYGHLPPISQIIQEMQTRHAEEVRINSLAVVFYGLLSMDTPVLADQQKLTFISCVDTECYLEDLPSAMVDRDVWQERVKGIYAVTMPWWWDINVH